MEKEPVVIIGAGLSGLSCALELTKNGIGCKVLEKGDAVGGRIRTDNQEGFLLDRGFQVILDSYPEISSRNLAPKLGLTRFEPGAFVRRGGTWHLIADPMRNPLSLFKTLLAPIGSFNDKLLIRKLRSEVLSSSSEVLANRPQMTTRQRLRTFGFSNEMLETFFVPFFGGVFLEKELATTRHKFDFLFKMFSQGYATLPQKGMQALPEALAEELPRGSVEFDAEAVGLEDTSVRMKSGQVIKGSWIVLGAYDAERALIESTPPTSFHGTICLYFSATHVPPILQRPILLLNGEGKGLINNLCCPSSVNPNYAPGGHHLVSVTVVGSSEHEDEKLTTLVQQELSSWFGTVAQTWKHLGLYRIPHALPAQPPGIGQHSYRLGSRLVRCGDHLHGASINGALESGKEVANIILEEYIR